MTFKPGAHNPTLTKWKRPKWEGAKLNADGLPLNPRDGVAEAPPVAPGFTEVGSGTAAKEPDPLPNKRGKGGRPTKAQARDAGKLEGARAQLEEVRAVNPPQLPVALKQRNKTAAESEREWEKGFSAHEKEIERREAESVLAYREDKLDAVNEETLIRRASRKTAMGFGGVAMRLVRVMDDATRKLEEKLKTEKASEMSYKELQGIISTAGSSIQRASASMEVAARLERLWMRSPLETEENGETDDREIGAEEAKVKLENVMKAISAFSARRGIKIIEAEATTEGDDAEVQS